VVQFRILAVDLSFAEKHLQVLVLELLAKEQAMAVELLCDGWVEESLRNSQRRETARVNQVLRSRAVSQ